MALTRPRVVVAGAGLAGLVSALELARSGCEVTLLEARGHPGGATFSFESPRGTVDNSLHLFAGCYTECLALLERLGTSRLLQPQPAVYPLWHNGRSGVLRLSPHAGRLALPLGLLGCGLWSGPERLTLLGHGLRLQRARIHPGETTGELLERLGLSRGPAARFWREWALSVFNGPLDLLDGALFRRTLERLFATAESARPLLASVSLGELLIDPLCRQASQAGVQLGLRSAVRVVTPRPQGGLEVTGEGGTLTCDHLLWAGPPQGLAAVWRGTPLPELPPDEPAATILNLHTRVAHWPWPANLVGLFGEPFQFLFAPPGSRSADHTGREVVLVASGLGPEAIAEPVVTDLLARLGLRETGPRHAVRQPRALPLQSPRFEQLRVPPGPLAPGLWICGAACRTGLPLTMESAVLSARLALEAMAGAEVGTGPWSA